MILSFLHALSVLAFAPSAIAQARADAGTPTSGTHIAPPGVQALARANAAYVARDWAAAMTAFREAQQYAEQRVQALLGVGHCMAQQGNADGALAAFREAVRASAGPQVLPSDRVRALQAVAIQLEAMTRWSEALAAWQEWVAFAEAHPTVANPAVGRARIQAIRARNEREQFDAQVRARIEERRRRNAQPPQPNVQ